MLAAMNTETDGQEIIGLQLKVHNQDSIRIMNILFTSDDESCFNLQSLASDVHIVAVPIFRISENTCGFGFIYNSALGRCLHLSEGFVGSGNEVTTYCNSLGAA